MQRITITVADKTKEWVDSEVESGRFRSVSHGFERGVQLMMNTEKHEELNSE